MSMELPLTNEGRTLVVKCFPPSPPGGEFWGASPKLPYLAA